MRQTNESETTGDELIARPNPNPSRTPHLQLNPQPLLPFLSKPFKSNQFVLFRLSRNRPVLVNFLRAPHQLPTVTVEIERNPTDISDVSETILRNPKERLVLSETEEKRERDGEGLTNA